MNDDASTKVWVRTGVLSEVRTGVASDKKVKMRKTSAFGAEELVYDWVLADVVSREENGAVSLRAADGDVVVVPAAVVRDAVLAANDPRAAAPSDLVNLVHLHEPAVVHRLGQCFASDEIYVDTGPILLAMNPFWRIPGIYDDATQQQYWQQGEEGGGGGENNKNALPPHVFRNADNAFRAMMRGLQSNDNNSKVNQSILVSGESGAGKTVSTKFIMAYLASLSQRKSNITALQRESPGKSKSSRGMGMAYLKALSSRHMSTSKLGQDVEEKGERVVG